MARTSGLSRSASRQPRMKDMNVKWIGWAGVNVFNKVGKRALTKDHAKKTSLKNKEATSCARRAPRRIRHLLCVLYPSQICIALHAQPDTHAAFTFFR